MSYAEFAVTSNFSFLQGASHPEELMAQAVHLGLFGLGLATATASLAWSVCTWPSASMVLCCVIIPVRGSVFVDGTPDILAYPGQRRSGA